jgi:hypothetical protein
MDPVTRGILILSVKLCPFLNRQKSFPVLQQSFSADFSFAKGELTRYNKDISAKEDVECCI